MTISRRHVALGIVIFFVAGAAGVWRWRAGRQFTDVRVLLSRFPAEDSVVLNIDFGAVRGAGLLAESKVPLEPEYKQFLDGTGFDYHRDLDSVTASFSKSGNFFIARGRFNWPKLREYAVHSGGSCYDQMCGMQGSTPQRRISFVPLRDDVMALSVSASEFAASRLQTPGNPITEQLPSAPVWVMVPGSALHEASAFPPGLRLMLSALTNADRLVLTVAPSGSELAVKMEATCKSKDDARVLASQLRTVTATLKDALSQDKPQDEQAQSDELVKFLVGGTFEDNGSRVEGQWPFSKALLAGLTSGI